MCSPAQLIEALVPRKSNRCESSLAVWFRALSTSWRSTLLTTSNEDVAATVKAPVVAECPLLARTAYGCPTRPRGAGHPFAGTAGHTAILASRYTISPLAV